MIQSKGRGALCLMVPAAPWSHALPRTTTCRCFDDPSVTHDADRPPVLFVDRLR
jgi:hypothetical protein